jgi:hypothetical protein
LKYQKSPSTAVLAVAAQAGAVSGGATSGVFGAFGSRSCVAVFGDRMPRAAAGGRLGMKALVNRLIAERRYDEALGRFAEIDVVDGDKPLSAAVRCHARSVARMIDGGAHQVIYDLSAGMIR